MKYLRYLLIFVPIAVAAELLHWDPLIIFSCSCIALVPLAGLLGEATEELAIHTGPKVGGLLNATLGNAAELIITIVALSAGKLDLVKASITGSILGVGTTKGVRSVRWIWGQRIVLAWILTLPATGLIGFTLARAVAAF